MSAEFQIWDLDIPADLAGERLDRALARLLPQHSRSRIRAWIDAGEVLRAGRRCRPSETVERGDRIRVRAAPAPTGQAAVEAEPIALNVVHRDAAFLVIDKPAGLVVHPGAGNPRHTLQNALLALDGALARIARAGIVHRLDKDTSGLLVVARTPAAHTALTRQIAEHSVTREYLAICRGIPTAGGTIDRPIGRHRVDRVRMAVRADGRRAVTHYRVLERFRAHALLGVRLETGRTHQIRLHLSNQHHPIVGDPLYGGRLQRPRGASEALAAALKGFERQALHATRLSFAHPRTGRMLQFESAPPEDFAHLLAALRSDAQAQAPAAPRRGA
ncbi:MAG TPA: 23S rRNA pseudouridine(1911/1915/1917) synthase RluD [Steroidobacteraceae bacterium]|nr:23S rRNA pseudouridine(1911/1915/1917) synthase RluD [Steroidobacteraceae bacterium]